LSAAEGKRADDENREIRSSIALYRPSAAIVGTAADDPKPTFRGDYREQSRWAGKRRFAIRVAVDVHCAGNGG
jgi:hypothetical protein